MGFDSFLDNSTVVHAVREMLARDRVPGSLLFTGPEGVGKATLAIMLAKALNCERLTDDFCGACSRCRKAEEMLRSVREDLARRREASDTGKRAEGLVYFDLQLIEPVTRFILTEQVRELRRVAYTRPFEFPHRIFIVDQAQTVHWQAIDLLLKVLEEPPPTTTFILLCPNAHELRPTIRSRTERMAFAPVAEDVIVDLIATRTTIPKGQRTLAARVAAGSVGRALTFDAAAFIEERRPWLDFLESVTGAGSSVNWRALFDSAKALGSRRDMFEASLGVGYTLLRDLLQVVEAKSDPVVIDPDLLPRLRAWASRLGISGIAALRDGLDQAYRLQTRNVNQQLGFENLGMDLISRRDARPSSYEAKGLIPAR